MLRKVHLTLIKSTILATDHAPFTQKIENLKEAFQK